MKIDTIFENNSGAEAPAAIKVAPATSSDILSLFAIILRAGTNLYTFTIRMRNKNRDEEMTGKLS
jgi:hypothetical protein